jgi:hypothetical protein
VALLGRYGRIVRYLDAFGPTTIADLHTEA